MTPGEALARYFDRIYPARADRRAAWSRTGEGQRASFVRDVLETTLADGRRSIADIGCGDGAFLASVLPPGHYSIHVSDLSEKMLDRARLTLAPFGEVSVHGGDGIDPGMPHADILIAIGVLDYWHDWDDRLAIFATRRNSLVILSLPAPSARQWLRSIWLAANGLSVRWFRKAVVERRLVSSGRRFRIERVAEDWMIVLWPDQDAPRADNTAGIVRASTSMSNPQERRLT